MKILILLTIVALNHNLAFATEETIETLIGLPTTPPKGLVIISPAKKYLMREKLFVGLSNALNRAGFITVRFNWAASTLEVPELELQKATENLYRVVRSSQDKFQFGAERTVIVSKSFSTKALGPSIALAKNHVLLTPNCSSEASFFDTYEEILSKPQTHVGIVISNEDPYCNVRQIHGTLTSLESLPTVFTTHGDHNFLIQENDQKNLKYQDQVIAVVSLHLSTQLE